ncbi:hypothetical protein [Nocardioides panaciterrulae]|nr:hypothetical protein [Nocardioides panaciterrulae]
MTVLLTAGLVAGCGADTASDPGASAGSTSTGSASPSPSTGPVDSTVLALISQTAVGGRVDPHPTVLDSRAAVEQFAGRFRGGLLQGRLQQVLAKADLGDGRVPVAAVVAVGCDVPKAVDVQRTPDGLQVTAQPVRSPLPECLAPVTTVAVVAVPSGAV